MNIGTHARNTLGCAFVPGPILAVMLSATAHAQPTFYYTPVSQNMTPDAQTFVGPVYDAGADQSWVHRLQRNGTHSYSTDRGFEGGVVQCNANASLIATEMYDLENLSGFGSSRTLAHIQHAGSPWTNLGPAPSGNVCDFTVNGVGGVARDTNEVLISGWTGRLCGPYRVWLFNPSTSVFTTLPVSNSGPPLFADARSARGDSISDDGTVVAGYDNNYDPLSHGLQGPRATVWRKAAGGWVQTVLDVYGGAAVAVSGDGNVIVGRMSRETMQSTFGTDYRTPVRWVRDGGTWTPQNLGGSDRFTVTAVSRDGSTVVGERFIWRADLNGGTAMPLDAYLSSIGANFHGLTIGAPGGVSVWNVSANGNSILVRIVDGRNPCLSTYGSGVIDLVGAPCASPVVVFDPVSMAIADPTSSYGIILNAFFAGTWELNYRWQKETAPDVWEDLVDDHCGIFAANEFDYRGTTTPQLRLGYLSAGWNGNYRCIATNGCGSATTGTASITPPCFADFNRDGGVDGADVEAFYAVWEAGDSQADVNGDGGVDGGDVEAFFIQWEAGGCG